MVRKTDADGYVTSYGYDPRKLVESINYSGGKEVQFAYDSVPDQQRQRRRGQLRRLRRLGRAHDEGSAADRRARAYMTVDVSCAEVALELLEKI